MSSNLGEHFWFSNIGISIPSYQHSEVLYLSWERLKLTLLLSLLVSVRDLSGIFAHEKVGRLSISTYADTLSFYGYVAMLKYSTQKKDDQQSLQLFSRPSSVDRETLLLLQNNSSSSRSDCSTKNNSRDISIFVTLSFYNS